MKRFVYLLAVLMFAGNTVFAVTNMPSEPVWNVPKTTVKSTSSGSVSTSSSSVEAVAKSLAQAGQNNNNSKMSELYMKLLDMGATNIKIEEYENGCPYRKGITPITLDGKTYSGQKCTLVKYTYQGKSTGTGVCK